MFDQWSTPIQAFVIVLWVIVAFFWALVVMTFNLYPNFQDSSAWEKRCRCFTCIMFCGAKRTTLADGESDWVTRLADLMSKVC